MKNENIISAWLNHNQAYNKNLKTDGIYLYSYDLPIARWGYSDDEPIVWDYTANGRYFSQTTSRHVGLALHMAIASGRLPALRCPHE